MVEIDTPFVRGLFPAFAAEEIADNAYFTHAGGTFPCLQVQGRLARYYRTRMIEPHQPFAPSREAGEEMDEAQARLAGLLGVAPEEVAFGASTAMNSYLLAQAFAERLGPGDAIVVTEQDHGATSAPWRALARRGIEVREWCVDRATGHLDPERLVPLLDGARMVCLPHVSNLLGDVNPVAGIAAMARAAGAFTCVDGAALAPHGLPDVGALGADAYLFSAHKCFGPHQGIMVLHRALSAALPDRGGPVGGRRVFNPLAPDAPDNAQLAACAGIADYFDALHDHHLGTPAAPPARSAQVRALIFRHEARLSAPVIDFLAYRNSVRMLGPQEPTRRVPVISVLPDRPPAELRSALAERGVMAGAGNFGAQSTLRALGADPGRGVLRLSLCHANSTQEVDRLIDALDWVI